MTRDDEQIDAPVPTTSNPAPAEPPRAAEPTMNLLENREDWRRRTFVQTVWGHFVGGFQRAIKLPPWEN